MKNLLLTAAVAGLLLAGCRPSHSPQATTPVPNQAATTAPDPNTTDETPQDHKLIIYQVLTRLFGNKTTTNKPYGTLAENGVGKFNDITDAALQSIKQLGVSHVWYTGVIEHATMTDYTQAGIPADDADVVKGRAGSPYAIKDYYDVDPDLAVRVPDRMREFEALVQRTHANGLKVLIDFIPNHVARAYHSDARPAGVADLGEHDDKTRAFLPANNFYYLPGQAFVVPAGYNPLGPLTGPHEDGRFAEMPAKATGNDVFLAAPSVDDWFETIKLNYGVDYENHRERHFTPLPATWLQMRDILLFWAGKGVDGFRCDMAEMVPVEFWAWVIPEVKKVHPGILFIGEAYNPKEYGRYFTEGQFDYLYDKVGLYDGLRRLMTNAPNATTADITYAWREESRGFSARMLRFLENHDEQRIASPEFAGNPRAAIPAMVVSATLGTGPVMVYFGQEVGEPGRGAAGFSTDDGRTTLFDYWGVPEHQKWMNGGKFDGGRLSESQRQLRDFYRRLLNLTAGSEAIRRGAFYELQDANNDHPGYDRRVVYSYLRYTDQQKLLIVANFSPDQTARVQLALSPAALEAAGLDPRRAYSYTDLLNAAPVRDDLNLSLVPRSACVFEVKER